MPANNMKVLMTADTLGGVWTYVVDLCTYYKTCNIEIILATMGAYLNKSQLSEIAELDNVSLFESNFKLEWMNDPWNDVNSSIQWLNEIIAKNNPDIIHLNTYAHGVIHSTAPVITVAHSDVLSWWSSVKNETAPECWSEYYSYVFNGITGSDLLIAPSASMLKMMFNSYGEFKNARVIYNGRNRELFNKKEKKERVLSAGRLWDEAKNIQLLVKAAPNIKWEVSIAGEEHHPCGQDFNTSNINFLGKLSREQMTEQLSATSIYVLPAKYEPFGLSVLEAALSGCALILGNIESLKEIWRDNAIYIDTDNHAELANKINELINSPGLLKHFADKAFNHAQKFSHENMARQYVNCYNEIILTKSKKKSYYEYHNVLSITPFRLESRKRPFSQRNSNRTNLQR